MKNYRPRQTLVMTGRRDSFEFWMLHVLEKGGLHGLLPAELCRLCGISARTARLWCDPRLSTYNKAFAEAFDYALTLSEAFWEGGMRMVSMGLLPNAKERSLQFLMERSFSRTKGNISDGITTREYHDAVQKIDAMDDDGIIDLGRDGAPEDPGEAYRWLLNEQPQSS